MDGTKMVTSNQIDWKDRFAFIPIDVGPRVRARMEVR